MKENKGKKKKEIGTWKKRVPKMCATLDN